MKKKLTKSRDKKLCGVCGGLAEYLDCDPTIIRILWVVASLAMGLGFIFYFIVALIMPDAPKDDNIYDGEFKDVN